MAVKKADDGLKSLKEKIKSENLTGIYVFTGEEKYARKTAVDAIRQKFEEYGFPEFNIGIFDEKEASVSEISDYAETFPVMSEYKLLIIRNSKIFKSATEEMKKFWTDILDNFPEYLAVVFDEDEIDGRSALIKKMKAKGIYAEFKYKTPAELAAWCRKLFEKAEIKVADNVIEQLVFSCDEGMENLKNEAEKLISYCGDKKTVLREDVDLIVRKSLKMHMFEMIDAISEKRTAKAYEMLNELKVYKESPIKIIALLGRQAILLLKTSVLLSENRYNDIASELGVHPFIARKYIDSARQTGTDMLSQMVEKCTQADYLVKSGMSDDWTAVEVLIGELVRT